MPKQGPQFVRAAQREGRALSFHFEDSTIHAVEGDSILAALLGAGALVRRHEFGGEPRGGFCLMGACQDCWIWSDKGGRIRACTTQARDGMILFATPRPRAAHE